MEYITRKQPAIDIDDNHVWNQKGIILSVFGGIISFAATLLFGYPLLFMIIHWRDMNFQRFAGCLILLLLTLIGGAQTIMCFNGITTGISNLRKRNRWLKQAVRSQVQIIDRKEEYNDYAESREEMWECSLAISWPPAVQGEPPGQPAWLRVSSRVFDRYRGQAVAHILCDPSDSNVFIFEGE